MRRTLIAVIGCSFVCAWALGDSWGFAPEVTKKTFEFGESKVVLEVDATRDQLYPTHTLFIYHCGAEVAKYKNVGFEKLYASKDNKYFVGLSNNGIPGTAFVVFDSEGNLIREQKHRFLRPLSLYTSMSVTRIRKWVDIDQAAQFEVRRDQEGRDHLISVFVPGSNGQRYDLLRPDFGSDADKFHNRD